MLEPINDPQESDESFKAFLESEGYIGARKLEDGEWVALMPLAFTLSVCCGIEWHTSFKYRWCFKEAHEALFFLENIKEFDDIPVRRTSLKGHRYLTSPLYMEKDERGLNKW